MREALVKAFTNSAGATVETKIKTITDCLTAMADTWGGGGTSSGEEEKEAKEKAEAEAEAEAKAKAEAEAEGEGGTGTGEAAAGDPYTIDVTTQLEVPHGKETLDNLIQSIQTYLMTISTPTSDPTIGKIEPFIYNIYRAMVLDATK